LGNEPKEMFKLDLDTSIPQHLASERLCETATALMNGAHYRSLGQPTSDLVETINTQPVVEKTSIRGSIIHIDSFYNVVTNISRDAFNSVIDNKPFSISFRGDVHKFKKVHTNYDDVIESDMTVMYNESGHLFIAVNKGKAAKLLGLKVFDTIRIEPE
jgi:S-adenosylmethionine hydrolase